MVLRFLAKEKSKDLKGSVFRQQGVDVATNRNAVSKLWNLRAIIFLMACPLQVWDRQHLVSWQRFFINYSLNRATTGRSFLDHFLNMSPRIKPFRANNYRFNRFLVPKKYETVVVCSSFFSSYSFSWNEVVKRSSEGGPTQLTIVYKVARQVDRLIWEIKQATTINKTLHPNKDPKGI